MTRDGHNEIKKCTGRERTDTTRQGEARRTNRDNADKTSHGRTGVHAEIQEEDETVRTSEDEARRIGQKKANKPKEKTRQHNTKQEEQDETRRIRGDTTNRTTQNRQKETT